MGRKSSLTPEQWEELIRRHLINGESIRSLAREYGIAESSIREHIRAHKEKIESVSKQIVDTTRAINALPISSQITAHSLAQKTLLLSEGVADVALDMHAVAKRVSKATKNRADSRTDEELMSEEDMKSIMAASLVVNQALRPANDYLATKAREKPEADPEQTIKITGGMDMTPVPYDHPPRNRSEDDL